MLASSGSSSELPMPRSGVQNIGLMNDDTSGNTEEKTPEHLRAGWLSVRVLQITGLAYLGPSAAQIRGMGRFSELFHAFRSQPSHFVPDLQFVTAKWLREKLLHQDELEDRRAVEDHLAQSLSSSKENPR